MTIRTKIEGDFKAINLASMADDMMAQVVANHAAERFRSSNRVNAVVAGGYVPYSVSVNGRTVFRGSGEIVPQQLKLAVRPPSAMPVRAAQRLPTIVFDWKWESLQPGQIERALETMVRIQGAISNVQDAAQFMRMLATNDRAGIFLLLLERYAARSFPELFARVERARALYRVYRLLRFGGKLLGKGDSDADPTVLAWIARELRARSPVQSGAYRGAHELWADGEVLMNAADVNDDAKLPAAEEFSFTNTVPYSRKIEVGKTKAGRAFVLQVAPNIYERTARDASQRFRDIADISFEMRAHEGGYTLSRNQASRNFLPGRVYRSPGQRADRAAGAALTYPTIIVRF